jgi:hypothetical protein
LSGRAARASFGPPGNFEPEGGTSDRRRRALPPVREFCEDRQVKPPIPSPILVLA